MGIAEQTNLFVLEYARGFSSGHDSQHAINALENIQLFAVLINWLRGMRFIFGRFWVLVYTLGGRHRFHTDAEYIGTHRMIVSVGQLHKVMWFRRGDMVSAIRLQHGAVVSLSEVGGGSRIEEGQQAAVEHATSSNDGGWIFAIEGGFREDEEDDEE